MAVATRKHVTSSRMTSLGDRIEYRLLLGIFFLFSLAVVAVRKCVAALSRRPSIDGGQSLFAEARSTALAVVGYAFIA